MAQAVTKATEASYVDGQASNPQVIADLILKAVRADKPHARYSAGRYARLRMFVRKWFGDRIFEKVVMPATKRARAS